jgi:hypothetical protein
MHLNFATDRILDAQLNAALQFRQHNLKSGTCGNLNGFVIQVQCELQVGHVTQTQGFQLIRAAQAVESLGLLKFDHILKEEPQVYTDYRNFNELQIPDKNRK